MAELTLGGMAMLLANAAIRMEHEQHAALELIGAHVEKVAKDLLGHDQAEWKPLADYTIAEKERLGFPTPSPLLRTGEHIRDTIHHHVNGHSSVEIGSDSDPAKWAEEGTKKEPPRPFLKTAVDRSGHAITELLTEAVAVALGNVTKP